MWPKPLPIAWLPWLLLLPLAILAWPGPGAVLADDPFPHLGGTGWLALGSLPAALWLALAGRSRPLVGLRLGLMLWACVSAAVWLGSHSDHFEARRAWLQLGTCLLLFTAGAQLDSAGRRCLNRGLVVLSILWCASALIAGDEAGYAGVLGNSGSLSQAALPGAVIGAWYVVSRRGPFWSLGLLAFTLFVGHAALAPVLAGGLSLVVALLLSSFLSPLAKRKEQVRRRLGVLAALCVFVLIGVRGLGRQDREPVQTASEAELEAPSDLGGVAVRLMIWRTIPEVLAHQPLLGMGPGQFQAAYPPYRDPREIEASRGGKQNAAETVVNHAHNDLLQGLAELGLPAGLLWLGFLGLVLRASLRAVRLTDQPTIASAAACLAILTGALLHSPLSMNPAAAGMACMLFGTVSSRHFTSRSMNSARTWRLLLVGGLIAGLPSAWSLISFGSAFSAHVRANKALLQRKQAGSSPELNQIFLRAMTTRQAAIDVAPDSAPSRYLAASSAQGEQALELWEAVLELRPFSVEALENIGLLHVRAERIEAARQAWGRALELSPTQPRILENLARMEVLQGDRDQGQGYLARLMDLAPLAPGLERYFGAQFILRGALAAGAPLLTGKSLDESSPILLNETYLELRKQGPELEADALRCLSQLLWAREHTRAGDYEVALRSYGQALRPTRQFERNGAAVLRAEMASVHFIAGDPRAARLEALGITLSDEDWQSLPDWSRKTLSDAGLLEGR